MVFGVEIAAAIAAAVAAAAAIWQGVLTRAAIKSAYGNSIAQERLVRLSDLYTALQETRQFARRLSKRTDEVLESADIERLFDLINKVRSNANMVAFAYAPGVFSELYARIADFVIWVAERKAPPLGKSGLEHISDTTAELSSAVFDLSMKLNMSRKN